MTRENAITVLKAFMENPLFSDEHKQAFNIAIHDIKQRHDWDINNLMLVPKTEWEQESTTKNDLGVDCISRADAIKLLENYGSVEITNKLKDLPSVYPKSDNSVLEDIKEKAELDEDYCMEIGEITIATSFREIIQICKENISGKENT